MFCRGEGNNNFTGTKMPKTVTYGLRQIFCWILLLQMINLSIDPPEVEAVFQTKSTQQVAASFAERESVYEYVSEELLSCDVPDSEEQDVEKSVHALELYYSNPQLFALASPEVPLQHLTYYSNHFSCWKARPHAPPPKA